MMTSTPPVPLSETWPNYQETPTSVAKLSLLCHSQKALQKEGYVLTQPSESEIWGKMRCQNCGSRLKAYRPASFNSTPSNQDQKIHPLENTVVTKPTSLLTVEQMHTKKVAKAVRAVQVATQKHRCFFHDGRTVRGIWSCCGGRAFTSGCLSNLDHRAGSEASLEENWQYYETPTATEGVSYSVHKRPGQRRARQNLVNINSAPQNQIRTAVALDCEMGTAATGDIELIRLSVVDFFTAETLIDKLVKPSVPMAHLNTRYSGVTFAALNAATRAGTCILGRDEARRQMFQYIGPDTIVVVHGGQNDFNALRWIQPHVVDTYILESYDLHTTKGRSLKHIAARKLGLTIQNAREQNGKMLGHDSLEDAMATRDVALWWLNTIPDI